MEYRKENIVKILNYDDLDIEETCEPAQILINFYKALGWDSDKYIINPSKIKTTKEIYNALYDKIFEKVPDAVSVGMLMVNNGPSVDESLSAGQIVLLEGWLEEDIIHE